MYKMHVKIIGCPVRLYIMWYTWQGVKSFGATEFPCEINGDLNLCYSTNKLGQPGTDNVIMLL